MRLVVTSGLIGACAYPAQKDWGDLKAGASIEDVALDALCRGWMGIDPAEGMELYVRLYLEIPQDAEELLAKGDYAQASEKLWGAPTHD